MRLSYISLGIKSTASGARIIDTPINTMGGDLLRINANFYDLSDEIHKTFYSTGYTGQTMKKMLKFSCLRIL